MLIRPHNTSRDLSAPVRKTTITRFNEYCRTSASKVKTGDVFATWPTIKAWESVHELPAYYEWNGVKLVRTTSPQSDDTGAIRVLNQLFNGGDEPFHKQTSQEESSE